LPAGLAVRFAKQVSLQLRLGGEISIAVVSLLLPVGKNL
jgi:hypothetical protein